MNQCKIKIKYLKTKIRFHKGKSSTSSDDDDVDDDGVQKKGSHCIVILIDFVLKIDKTTTLKCLQKNANTLTKKKKGDQIYY